MRRLVFIFFLIGEIAYGQLNIAYYLGAGRYDLYKENYLEAISRFTAVINSKPNLSEAYFLRGIAKYNLSDYRGALEDFTQAVTINPFFADAFHYRGITYEQLADFDNSRKDLLTALELNPTSGRIYADLGIIHLMQNEYKKAYNYFNEALKIDRSNPDTYFNRAICFIHMNDTIAAINDLQAGLRINPFSAEAYRRLGTIYYEKEQYALAIQQFNKALELDDDNTMILFQRAIAYYQLHDFSKALTDLQKILDLEKDNALVYYNRALIYSELGKFKEAIDDYTNAMLINPDNILIYYNRAGVKIELKDYRGALNDYNKAIEIFPDFATAYFNRSYVKSMLGDKKGAYLDQLRAEKLIAEHRKFTNDTSQFAILRDTTYNLKKLLDFDSEFSNNFTRSRLQNRPTQISRQGYYLLALEQTPPKENLPFIEALFAYNQRKNSTWKLYPKLLAKFEPDLESNDSLSISDIELFVLQKVLASANKLNYYNALELLRKNKNEFQHTWLYYFLEGTIEAVMNEYVNSFIDISSQTKLTESGATQKIGSQTIIPDYNRAEEALNESLKENPTFSLAWYNKGNIKIQNQNFREAIDDYTKAIDLDENIAEAYFNRGLTFLYLRETDRGCLDVSRAGQLGIVEAYNVIKRFCEKKSEKK
ncbi:MAG TPA: tetratricopeptide repeat protein [Salinivirgaceae bacterium]|nr:tetratricopeptide repeat protein [Salinivirgaceae bacterium]